MTAPLPHGKLWYDDNKSGLEEKIARALRHYKDLKFDAVFVRPGEFPQTVCGLQIIQSNRILLHHFFFCNLGNGERAAEAQPAVTRTGG